MNVFNKIVIIILLVFFTLVSIFGILNAFVKWITWSDLALKIFNPHNNVNPYIATLALLFVIVFCACLLFLEFRRKKNKTAVVASVKEGTASITLESIANQIKESLSKIQGTKDLEVKVLAKSKGIVINISTKICEDCNLPQKMQEIIKTASSFASSKLGLKVVKTNLTVINLTNMNVESNENSIALKEIKKEDSDKIDDNIIERT